MLWSDFKADAANVRDKEPKQFDDMSDIDCIELNLDQSKRDMLIDLQQAFGFELETDTDFEAILDTHNTVLKEALSVKQIYWYYFNLDFNQGHQYKADKYRSLYNAYKIRFGSLVKKSGQHVGFQRMYR